MHWNVIKQMPTSQQTAAYARLVADPIRQAERILLKAVGEVL